MRERRASRRAFWSTHQAHEVPEADANCLAAPPNSSIIEHADISPSRQERFRGLGRRCPCDLRHTFQMRNRHNYSIGIFSTMLELPRLPRAREPSWSRSSTLVAAGEVLVDPGARAAPRAVGGLGGLGGGPALRPREARLRRSARRPGPGSGTRRDGPAMAGTTNLWRLSRIARARSSPRGPWSPWSALWKCGQVSPTITLEDDRWGIAEPDQEQIENEPACAPVAVEKWMDLLKARMRPWPELRARCPHPPDPAPALR